MDGFNNKLQSGGSPSPSHDVKQVIVCGKNATRMIPCNALYMRQMTEDSGDHLFVSVTDNRLSTGTDDEIVTRLGERDALLKCSADEVLKCVCF